MSDWHQHPSEEGSPQCIRVMQALSHIKAASVQGLMLHTKMEMFDVTDALMGLRERGWLDTDMVAGQVIYRLNRERRKKYAATK